jgi:hypothetical protein
VSLIDLPFSLLDPSSQLIELFSAPGICLSLKEPRETFWLEPGFLGMPYLARGSVQKRVEESRREKEKVVVESEQ